MAYLIFFTALLLLLMAKRMQPVRNWWDSFNITRGMASLLVLSLSITFITSGGGDTSGIPSGVRLLRFALTMIVLFWAIKIIVSRMDKLSYVGKPMLFMVLYGLYCMLSAVYSVDPYVSAWKGMEVFTLVLVGVCVATQLEKISDIRHCMSICCLFFLFLSLTIILGLLMSPGQAWQNNISTSLVVRGVGPPMNPNTVTQMCALSALMVFPIALNGKEQKAKLAWIIFGLGVGTMLLGHGRTSIFAFLLAFSSILYFSGRKLVSVVLVAGGGLSIMFLEFVLIYIYRGQTEEKFTSLTGRVDWWENAYKVVEQAPIFGHGYYAAQRQLLGSQTVDSSYIDVLIGLGFTGLAIVVIPVILSGARLFATRPVKNEPSEFQIVWLQLMSLYILLIVRSITGTTFQVLHPNLVLYVILLASVEAYARIKRNRKFADTPKDVESQVELLEQDRRILSRKKTVSKFLGGQHKNG